MGELDSQPTQREQVQPSDQGEGVEVQGRTQAAPPSGGTLAGLALSVGSAKVADGSTVVAVGTASAAAMQQQAERLAASA